MELKCPGCNSAIRTENVNITTDLAKCDFCHTMHKVGFVLNVLIFCEKGKYIY
jgi:hypothetical protein